MQAVPCSTVWETRNAQPHKQRAMPLKYTSASERKRPQSMAEERYLQPCVHCCKTASHLLDLIQGVVVCADACIVDCGEPHYHRVPDAALHASHTTVRANALYRFHMSPQVPNAMLQIPRAQVLRANAVVQRADVMTMPALQTPKHMTGVSLGFLPWAHPEGAQHEGKNVMM